ncbi:MAG: hypothetical protein G01um1014106_655, partial [Parcubacteria group bacterium Gr01-1014_106]
MTEMHRSLGVLVLLVAGVSLRVLFLMHQPFTNDEGFYLYDAKVLLERRLPGGDVLTKSPVTAGLFLGSVWLTHGSLYAARLVSVALNLLTTIPLFFLATRLFRARVGRWAAVLWLLAAGPVIFAVFGQTEATAGFFATSALALWVHAALPSPGVSRRPWWYGMLAGSAFMLAWMTRKTEIALLVPMILLWWQSSDHRRRWWLIVSAGFGGCLVLFPWLVAVAQIYGPVGVREALGGGYARLVGYALHPASRDAAFPWAQFPELALRVAGRTMGPLGVLALLGLMGGRRQREQQHAWVHIPYTWFGAMLALYAFWPTILPDYLPEFFPALTLLAAESMSRMSALLRRWQVLVLGTCLVLWNVAAFLFTLHRPWVGMFTTQAIYEAAEEMRRLVPPEEPLFTAAVVIPYVSGHRVLFDIAHPLWYRIPPISQDTRETFLPPLEQVETAVRSGAVRWALVEHVTDYAYLRHASDLLSVIWEEFTFIREIPNDTGFRSNSLLLWRR